MDRIVTHTEKLQFINAINMNSKMGIQVRSEKVTNIAVDVTDK